jgi:hypothetical protein
LASFNAQSQANQVVLEWTTATEISTYCFRVYRATDINGEFSAIEDYIPAVGNTASSTSYEYTDNSVEPGVTYYYQLADVNKYGWETVHSTVASATPGTAVGVVAELRLDQNYPNPFNAETSIHFSIPTAGHVDLAVYDLNGRKVDTLINGYRSAGAGEVTWNASSYSAGVYVYRLTAGDNSISGKMIYMK